MTTTAIAKFSAPAIPLRHDTLFNAAPGSDITISGVLDGHEADQLWVLIGWTTSGSPPVLVSDFDGLGHEEKILEEDTYSQKMVGGLPHFTATVKGAYTAGDCTKFGWIALLTIAAGSSPDPSETLLLVLGPYRIRAVG